MDLSLENACLAHLPVAEHSRLGLSATLALRHLVKTGDCANSAATQKTACAYGDEFLRHLLPQAVLRYCSHPAAFAGVFGNATRLLRHLSKLLACTNTVNMSPSLARSHISNKFLAPQRGQARRFMLEAQNKLTLSITTSCSERRRNSRIVRFGMQTHGCGLASGSRG